MTKTSTPENPLPLEHRPPQTSNAIAPQTWIGWLNIFGSFLALLAIYAFFYFQAERFGDARTLETLMRQMTIVAIAAMGMTLIIVSGGIDLSVGSQLAVVAVAVALILKAGYNPWLAALGGIGAGAACGLINGLLITGLRVVPFIVTLGTLGIFRGVAKQLAHHQPVNAKPKGLENLTASLGDGQRWMLVPPGVWIMLIIVAATALMLRYSRFGRHVVAVGSNEQTARLCGVRVNRTKILVYTLAGALTGVAGIMLFSRLTQGDPTSAAGDELDIIAAVVIGGGSLSGGEGSPLGTLIGAAIMQIISAGGAHLGWENSSQEIITGVIIVIAVTLDRLRHRRAAASEG
ncbi:MAG: ribose transport system permease protein [Phycisphaerales bacterium]|jgi:ribose/xylose/arabinose/galactoside ABC-type transport system permease subunit|nr:ribose transport system permease protein [Phycisphaerales bacterium]